MKLLAIDYGEKRVGLATSDTEVNLALPHGVLARESDETLVKELIKLINTENIAKIIIGSPMSLSGDKSDQTRVVDSFVGLLKKQINIPVEMIDERLTSRQALHLGQGSSVRGKDELAAMFILQDWMDRSKNV